MLPKARKKKTAFVPSVVFSTVVVGVIPACVLSSCGGSTVSSADASSDAMGTAEVANVCFGPNSTCPPCCGVAAVAYTGFDSGDANDAAAEAPSDSPADMWQQDVLPGVAAVGFCAFCDGGEEGG